MHKVLVSIPDSLIDRMKAVIPSRQRSKILSKLLEDEVKRREADLYRCARDVENDKALVAEMKEWDVTTEDGIDDETW
jgi:metal-responsive CopG/Arc/MetJ family transcriptional regulator